jgi:hypothetical protein
MILMNKIEYDSHSIVGIRKLAIYGPRYQDET